MKSGKARSKKLLGIVIVTIACLGVGCWWTRDFYRKRDSSDLMENKKEYNNVISSLGPVMVSGTRAFADSVNVPISFYGRVIDEDGHPISNVSVKFEIWKALDLAEVAMHSSETTAGSVASDSGGRFLINGYKGYNVNISTFTADGYRQILQRSSFSYDKRLADSHYPEWGKPVDFVMIDAKHKPATCIIDSRMKFSWNGGESTLDLGGNVGKIILNATRENNNPEVTSSGFEWQFRFFTNGFELVEERSDWLGVAPISGYNNDFEYGSKHDSRNWFSNMKKRFYLRTADGRYGSLEISFSAKGESDSKCGVILYMNSSGARNVDRIR